MLEIHDVVLLYVPAGYQHGTYVCMYKLYLMTVTPGYKVISPRAVLLVKVSIEVQYIY